MTYTKCPVCRRWSDDGGHNTELLEAAELMAAALGAEQGLLKAESDHRFLGILELELKGSPYTDETLTEYANRVIGRYLFFVKECKRQALVAWEEASK